MQLGERDGDADAGEHAMDDGRGDDKGAAGHLKITEEKLHQARTGGRQADRLPAQLLDESKNDYRESGGRARDLQRRTRQETGDDASGDGANQTGDHRSSGSQGDAQ